MSQSGALQTTTAIVPEPGLELTDGRPYHQAIKAFADLTLAIDHTNGRDELLHLLSGKLCELVGMARCSIFLRDDQTGAYHGRVLCSITGDDDRVKRCVISGDIDEDYFTREIVMTQRPVVIEDAMGDPRTVKQRMRAWRIQSMMGIPMVLQGEVIGIFFVDSQDECHAFTKNDREVASAFARLVATVVHQSRITEQLRAQINTATRQNGILRRALAVDDEVTNLVFEDLSVLETANRVNSLTSRPCLILGENLEILAQASGGSVEQLVALREHHVRTHPTVVGALESIGVRKPALIGPLPGTGLDRRVLVAAITDGSARWGSIVLGEKDRPFGPFDMFVLRKTATMLALQVRSERRATQATSDVRATLIDQLLRGGGNPEDLARRAEYLGLGLSTPRVLCLVTAPRGEARSSLCDSEICREIQGAGAGSVHASYVPEGVVAIIECRADLSAAEGVRRVKEAVELAGANLPTGTVMAISTICRSATDYPRAYGAVQQVVRCAIAFSPDSDTCVFTADELGAALLVLSVTDPEKATRFADETLGCLVADGSGDLVPTLRVFFETGRNIRASAAALGIHENTVRYRLASIEKLSGLAVASDADAQLRAQLALLVSKLRGQLGA
jgi:sugar diacid utilization regulator